MGEERSRVVSGTSEGAEAIAAAARDPRLRIVLIDGPSGAGKSTLATQAVALLREHPRREVVLVRMDDLYPGWSGLDEARRAVELRVVRPHRLGLAGCYRRWNWASDSAAGWLRVPAAPLLLVEGCGAAGRGSRRLADLTVWVDTDPVSRRDRALARDGDAFAPHWEMWDDQFSRYCAAEDPSSAAGLVVRT